MVRILILAIFLAGCQTAPKGGFCATAKPIRLTAATVDAMTDAEVTRALEHNTLGQRLCNWKP